MSFRIRAQKKMKQQSSTSLPDDVMFDILARVPRRDYPTLSLVSKRLRSLVKSPELYTTRSLLGFTEACIHVVLENTSTNDHRFYILQRRANGKGLVLVQSPLPPMPFYPSYVPVGSRVYCLGGIYGQEWTSHVLKIDCCSHTVQLLPSIPMRGASTVAGIVDGKIYLVSRWVIAVFDIETQMWEPEITKLDMLSNLWGGGTSRVISGKMHIQDCHNSFVYMPKENKWETNMLDSIDWRNACVIDDILYKYDYRKNKLRSYDPKQKHWGVVKGVKKFKPKNVSPSQSHTVNYGEKLIVFLAYTREIWCAEIALERRQGKEIWGKVERCELVFRGRVNLTDCITVTV